MRHRDVKLKDREEKREEHMSRAMCEGICDHCRDKVQWRFQFNKYKPLTKPGTCQRCKNKTIVKAYRTLCDSCSSAKRECACCCGDIVTLNRERHAKLGMKKAAGSTEEEEEEEDEEEEEEEEGGGGGGAKVVKFTNFKEATKIRAAAGGGAATIAATADDFEEDSEGDYEAEEEGSEGEETAAGTSVGATELESEADLALPVQSVFHISKREIRQFEEYGASKYSKERVVGSAKDKELSEDLSKHTNEQRTF